MIINLTNKIIFVANLKTASTSIEHHLRRNAEIAILKTQYGKHNSLATIAHQFNWVFNKIPAKDFFIFGVVRDPVDYLLSLYNSHQREVFDGTPASTKGMTFEEYFRAYDIHAWQRKPQSERLIDIHGRLALTHLVRFSELETDIPAIFDMLGVPLREFSTRNLSPKVASRADVTPEVMAAIRDTYASDYDLIKHGPRDPNVVAAAERLKESAMVLE